MKTFNKLFLLMFGLLMVASCSKDSLPEHLDTSKKEQLPTIVNEQLTAVQENLHKYMGTSLKLIDYKTIARTNMDLTLETIANPNSIVAYGNIMEPHTVHIGSMRALTNSRVEEGIRIMKEHASKTIKKEDLSMEITWLFNGKEIRTIAFYNNSGISWDNLMVGLIMMDPKPIETETITEEDNGNGRSSVRSKFTRRTWTGNWIWGSRRGSMHYELKITYQGSSVLNTTINDGAWMNIGSAKSESKVTRRTGRFGEGKYALGIATPVASLTFNHSNFEVSVSGIGSSIVRNGTRDLWP